jgi:hypothetical protein
VNDTGSITDAGLVRPTARPLTARGSPWSARRIASARSRTRFGSSTTAQLLARRSWTNSRSSSMVSHGLVRWTMRWQFEQMSAKSASLVVTTPVTCNGVR